jgi:hypothetical protein
MSIEGRIAIDVNFADSSDATGVQSLKKISLVDTSSYSSGKVAIVTGTCGTAAVTIATAPTSFKDAAGNAVSFSAVQRIAFAATPHAVLDVGQSHSGGDNSIRSKNGQVAVVDASGITFAYTTAGTASYTVVIYGT